MTYLATAYRWGFTNAHQYHVWCGTDRETAIAFAKSECADRAGKYGVHVLEFDGGESKVIHYSPSSYGESAAHRNDRIELFERVGQDVVMLVEDESEGREAVTEQYVRKRIEYHQKMIDAENGARR